MTSNIKLILLFLITVVIVIFMSIVLFRDIIISIYYFIYYYIFTWQKHSIKLIKPSYNSYLYFFKIGSMYESHMHESFNELLRYVK